MKSTRSQHFLAVIILALTWGSSFILMKRGLKDEMNQQVLQPAQVAALRLGLAGLILLPVSLRALPKVRLADWKFLCVVGLLGSGLPAVLFSTSQQYLDSSIAGILNALTPLFTLLVGISVFKRIVSPKQVMGVLVGLGGAVCLISLKGFGNSENWSYSFLIILATLFYGISVNTISSKLGHMKPLDITALSLLIAGLPWSIYLFTTDFTHIVSTHPHGLASFGYIAILSVMGTCVANMLYFWLTQQTSPLFASSVTYLMPLVAVGWGIGDGEHFGMFHILCALIILTGVWLVNKKPALKN
jgi:drug/metabolite transporter (DMT)-like permease